MTETPEPETLETVAARIDHLDATLHAFGSIMSAVRDQLAKGLDKQSTARDTLDEVRGGMARVSDLLTRHEPLLERAEAFMESPVSTYLDSMRNRKGRRRGTENQ